MPDDECGRMTLWSIQTDAAWRELRERSALARRADRVFPEFLPAYQWMMRQMTQRLPGYGGGYPVWVWLRPKPDLRRIALLPPATRGVRLTLSMEPERLLLSDFEAWHCVLNRWYLSLDDEENAAWNARLPVRPSDLCALRPALNAEMHRSWERIFDLPLMTRSGWSNGDDQMIQGVCEQIFLADVVRVEPFIAR